MEIISRNDPFNPEILFSDTGIAAHDNSLFSNLLVSAGHTLSGWGIRISDITNPHSPIFISECPVGESADRIFISGSYAYIRSEWYYDHYSFTTLYIADISNPQVPFVCSYYCEFFADIPINDIFVQGSYAFLSAGDWGLKTFNISDPYGPYLVSNYDSSIVAYGIKVGGSYAYVGDRLKTLQIIDISDPTNPRSAGACSDSFPTNNICIQENYAFVAGGEKGIRIVDITDPQNPQIVDSFDTPGLALDISAKDDFIYIADAYSLITLHSPYVSGINEENTPASLFLSQSYPNPFNNFATIEYAIPKMANVTIEIFDIQGRKIDELINHNEQPGYHKVVWNTRGKSSGVYFYKIKAGEYSETKKMLLLK